MNPKFNYYAFAWLIIFATVFGSFYFVVLDIYKFIFGSSRVLLDSLFFSYTSFLLLFSVPLVLLFKEVWELKTENIDEYTNNNFEHKYVFLGILKLIVFYFIALNAISIIFTIFYDGRIDAEVKLLAWCSLFWYSILKYMSRNTDYKPLDLIYYNGIKFMAVFVVLISSVFIWKISLWYFVLDKFLREDDITFLAYMVFFWIIWFFSNKQISKIDEEVFKLKETNEIKKLLLFGILLPILLSIIVAIILIYFIYHGIIGF